MQKRLKREQEVSHSSIGLEAVEKSNSDSLGLIPRTKVQWSWTHQCLNRPGFPRPRMTAVGRKQTFMTGRC